jgi:hypothetical protein
MKSIINKFREKFDVCKPAKMKKVSYCGMLQPLLILKGIWRNITTNFMEGLPRSRGKNAILVIVGRFSKYAHFLVVTHSFAA